MYLSFVPLDISFQFPDNPALLLAIKYDKFYPNYERVPPALTALFTENSQNFSKKT